MPHVIKKLRSNFAARLSEALTFAGLDNSPTSLARHFNRHAGGYSITMHGARRWLLGESMPTQKHMAALARSLGVSSDWLLLGQGAMQDGVSTAPRLKVVKTEEPPKRQAGIKVGSPAELVAKLKEAGAI